MRQRSRPLLALWLVSVPEWACTWVRWLWTAEVTHNLTYSHESRNSGVVSVSSALSTCLHLLCGKGTVSGAGSGNAFRQDRSPPTCKQRLDPQIAEKQRRGDAAILVWYSFSRENLHFITFLCLLLLPRASLFSSSHLFCRAHKPECNLLFKISP